jgi:hypothetical protein
MSELTRQQKRKAIRDLKKQIEFVKRHGLVRKRDKRTLPQRVKDFLARKKSAGQIPSRQAP